MALRISTIKISGMPSERGWSQSYEYLSDENDQWAGISLMIVFSTIRNDIELDDAVVGRDLLNLFRKLYFSDKERSPDVALKESVKEVFDNFFQKLDGLEIAAATFVNEILYTCCINGGKASLYRDGFLVKILDSNSPHLVSASGYPKEGDVMVLATGDLYKKMSILDVKNSLSKGLENASDDFSIQLHDTPTVGVCLISFLKNGNGVGANNVSGITEEKKEISLPFNFGGKIAGIFNNFKNSLPRKRIYLLRREGEDYIPSGNKKAAIVGIILIALLAVSVIFGVYKNSKDKFKESYADTLSTAGVNIEDAIQLMDVDIVKSRESFLAGKNLIQKLLDQKISDPEIDRLSSLISENQEEILGERKVTFDMWLDLTLITDGFSSESISFYNNSLGILDSNKRILINVEVKGKKSITTKIPDEIEDINKAIIRSDGYYILAGDGVYRLSKKDKVIDKNWKEAVFVRPYAANIYFLDKGNGEILKSSGSDNAFSEAKKWTTDDQIDFSQSKSFSVDGYAWVLNPDQEILKFSYGNRVNFKLSGYPYDLPDYDLMYTNDGVEDLYLLDREGKIVSVFSKDGEYKYNLMSDTVSEAKDFIVTDAGEIILFNGEKLYELKI